MEKISDFPVSEPRYLKFVELFNEKKFFEAHEILESLWKEMDGPERNFLKGLIQIAAAFVHVQRKNLKGARQLFKTASGYLRSYSFLHKGIDSSWLLSEAGRVLNSSKEFPKLVLEMKK